MYFKEKDRYWVNQINTIYKLITCIVFDNQEKQWFACSLSEIFFLKKYNGGGQVG